MVGQRLPSGGHIDRAASCAFSFDGKAYIGHPGDTLASALMASGVRLFGRSFKYHRPRGLLSAGPEEPNALVELRDGARREPNTRATTAELFDGLTASSQNRWPSLAFDLQAINQFAGPLLSAGFYYKTFMWPASFWEKVYEPLIRKAAGLGRASGLPDPDAYEKATLHCDVLVVGSGPAGLMAALVAGRSGARVVLAEQDFILGGRLLDERITIDDAPAERWRLAVIAELESQPETRILTRTTVFGTYDQRAYGAVERVSDHLSQPADHGVRQRAWRIIAKRAILASGSIERPMLFGNNDLPGVMLAGAVRTYLNRYGVLPGRTAVVFGSCDDAALTVRDLHAAGAKLAAVVDPRPDSSEAMRAAAREADVPLFAGAVVLEARGTRQGIQEAVIVQGNGAELRVACDLLAMSGGWNPTLHLTSHLGHKPVWNPQISALVPDRLPDGMSVAGAASGMFSLAAALETGGIAGVNAAESLGFTPPRPSVPATMPEPASVSPHWRAPPTKAKVFVDFQNDVTADDIAQAEREGFRAAEHMKRYTTLGMATDQGKTAGVTGAGVLAELTGKDVAQVGVTTFRPPFTAVSIGALAGHGRGRDFRPTRLTPGHGWAKRNGAVFTESGAWLRAQYFPVHQGEDWLSAATREVNAVRQAVGFCDVSTLGKIDVQGADAGALLDRLYANMISTLPVGKARYGLMLREDGFVFDDGTVSRLAEQHWLVTTTTANAARVLQHMEHAAQVLWPQLDVRMASVTEQWMQVAVAGPKSRAVLQRIVDAVHDISNAAFPYMAAGAVSMAGGLPARLFRISFSGELAYEIAVPAGYGDALLDALMQSGAEFGIRPYGIEALSIMRIEKGHAAGGELSGQTTATDLGLGRMLSTKKDFIGRMMSRRPALVDPARPALVGFRPVARGEKIGGGAHLLDVGAAETVDNDLGYLTSVAYSPSLGHMIGLGLMKHGPSRIGDRVLAHDPVRGRNTLVEVCAPVFIDPEGSALRG